MRVLRHAACAGALLAGLAGGPVAGAAPAGPTPASTTPTGADWSRLTAARTEVGARQRCLAGDLEPGGGVGIDARQAVIEQARDPLSELRVAHRVIPLRSSQCASAWVAREQWVLTLPSEHPIAAAVSATSSSSQ